MITFKHQGNFNHTESFLKKAIASNYMKVLEKYANQGVVALTSSTPADTGETANSWSYKIKRDNKGVSIIWENSHIVDGVPIAILIQYGHGTGTGGYVQGIDYINPTMRPIFDKIANELWGEVSKL